METDFQIVDSHQHFWQVGRFDYPWMKPELGVLYRDYLPPELGPLLADTGVSKTVLVQASNTLDETRWLLSLANDYPFIGGVVGWIDLAGDHAAAELDEFANHPKFKGVRHLVESEPDDDWLIQPEVRRGLRTLAGRGFSYDLLVHTRHLKYASRIAQELPELRLVLDHLAKPPIARREIEEWTREFRDIADCPNVSCKLSGLVTEADWHHWKPEDLRPFVDKALECFGPKRLMFGSDWPVCLLAATYEQILESLQWLLAELSHEERKRIFAENAEDFYGLHEQAQAAG
jgi:L-fucono-1,5-lactonase